MKTLKTIVSCLVMAAVASGCGNGAPTDLSTDAIGSPHLAADQNWTYGSFTQNPGDFVVFIDCAGEEMDFYGEVPFRFHEVSSEAGVYNFHFQLLNWAQSPTFVAEGQTTGRIFTFRAGPFNQTIHVAAGEVQHIPGHERYVADKGNWIASKTTLHMTVNANGELVVDRDIPTEWTCHLKD